ncbi:hypothetical protein JOD54_002602 [Actinokineospora baliensis]|nr:hypothetical protein [Actinokineospora baliensis]
MLDGADLVCAGPLRQPWQDRKAGAEKRGPVRAETLRLPPPHAKQVRPIEQFGWTASGSGGRGWHQRLRGRLAFGIALDPWWCGVLDGADLVCAGPLRYPWQDRKSRGRKAWPCSEARLRAPPPHTNQVRPIEHWVGGFLGAVVGLAGLARWAGLAGPVRGGPVCSMGRTWFARGPCATRGRTAKLGPKSMALSAHNATGTATPHKPSPPHRAFGACGFWERWSGWRGRLGGLRLGGLARWAGFAPAASGSGGQVGWAGSGLGWVGRLGGVLWDRGG